MPRMKKPIANKLPNGKKQLIVSVNPDPKANDPMVIHFALDDVRAAIAKTNNPDYDPAFDHMAWQSELEIAKRKGSSLTPTQRNDALKQRYESIQQKIKEHLTSKGPIFKSELEDWMRTQGGSKNVAQSLYSSMLKNGDLAKVTEHLTNRVYVGTQEAIAKLLAESPPETYRLR